MDGAGESVCGVPKGVGCRVGTSFGDDINGWDAWLRLGADCFGLLSTAGAASGGVGGGNAGVHVACGITVCGEGVWGARVIKAGWLGPLSTAGATPPASRGVGGRSGGVGVACGMEVCGEGVLGA